MGCLVGGTATDAEGGAGLRDSHRRLLIGVRDLHKSTLHDAVPYAKTKPYGSVSQMVSRTVW